MNGILLNAKHPLQTEIADQQVQIILRVLGADGGDAKDRRDFLPGHSAQRLAAPSGYMPMGINSPDPGAVGDEQGIVMNALGSYASESDILWLSVGLIGTSADTPAELAISIYSMDAAEGKMILMPLGCSQIVERIRVQAERLGFRRSGFRPGKPFLRSDVTSFLPCKNRVGIDRPSSPINKP